MADKTMIYVGTEAGIRHQGLGGLYRKEAGAGQWQDLSTGLHPKPIVRVIAIHPQDPDVVFVGTQRGVYRSVDGGDRWERMDIPEGRIVWSLMFHPDNPQEMYLGTEGSELYRSVDGGESWEYWATISNPNAVSMEFSTRIFDLALEPPNPDVMYAALEVAGAARSFDRGKTWEIVNQGIDGSMDHLDLHGVAVGSPLSDSLFIANRVGVWRSRDRGEKWVNTHLENFSSFVYSRGVQVAPDDPDKLYACIGGNFFGQQGGVLRSTDLGETWHRFDRGISPGSTTMGVAVNPRDPEQVYFCTREGEVFGTHDGGAHWEDHHLPESAKDLISVACTSV